MYSKADLKNVLNLVICKILTYVDQDHIPYFIYHQNTLNQKTTFPSDTF